MLENKEDKKYPLLVILGPTAVGKTDLSLNIAKKIKGEIISADSMQIYKKMDIGTAKITLEERKIIPHYMLDIIEPSQEYSVADYQKEVDKLIPQIIKKNKMPILVGGTGLYIKATVKGFLFPEMKSDLNLREKLEKEAQNYGNNHLHEKLAKIDPKLANKLHPNDLRRIIRGIEVYQQTGKTLTYFKEKQAEKKDRYHNLKIGLIRDRNELYERINQRVDIMIKEGLIDEVKNLLNYNLSATAKQGLGYKEILAYLEENYDLTEAIRLLKRNTRHFAKRQITWFKRDKNIHWFNLSTLKEKDVYQQIITLVNKTFKH